MGSDGFNRILTGFYLLGPVRVRLVPSGSPKHMISRDFYQILTRFYQDDEKGGLSLRGVAVTTETATTAETAKTVTAASWHWTAKTVKTAKTVMKATPLKPNPPFPSSWF